MPTYMYNYYTCYVDCFNTCISEVIECTTSLVVQKTVTCVVETVDGLVQFLLYFTKCLRVMHTTIHHSWLSWVITHPQPISGTVHTYMHIVTQLIHSLQLYSVSPSSHQTAYSDWRLCRELHSARIPYIHKFTHNSTLFNSKILTVRLQIWTRHFRIPTQLRQSVSHSTAPCCQLSRQAVTWRAITRNSTYIVLHVC